MSQEKILVVDAEENFLALLKRVLTKGGYQVVCARSGKAALDLLRAERFSTVIVDASMPDMEGLCLLMRLKEMEDPTPVIMISSTPSWEKEQKARAMGCREFLLKPLDIKALKALLGQIIRDNESRRRRPYDAQCGDGLCE